MRIDNAVHRTSSWRVDAIAADFELLDVWRLPMTGRADQLPDVIATLKAMDPGANAGSGFASALFRLRDRMGRVFGWDREVNTLPIPGCRETSVRDRLAPEHRAVIAPDADAGMLGFRPVFQDAREVVMELSNGTVHALMQIVWVPEGDHHRGRMAVYVKSRGRMGSMYMHAIAPFRHLVVYPAMMRRLEALWGARGPVS